MIYDTAFKGDTLTYNTRQIGENYSNALARYEIWHRNEPNEKYE